MNNMHVRKLLKFGMREGEETPERLTVVPPYGHLGTLPKPRVDT